MGHGRLWKMTKNDFSKNKIPRTNDRFHIILKQLLDFRSWKTSKKSWERSWKVKEFYKIEPYAMKCDLCSKLCSKLN